MNLSASVCVCVCGMLIEYTGCRLCPVNGEQMRGNLYEIWRRITEPHTHTLKGWGKGGGDGNQASYFQHFIQNALKKNVMYV